MLNAGFKDAGYEFYWEPEFAPPDSTDEFWAAAFQRFGGSVVITGDKNIGRRPHQMLAFQQCQLTCFFCGGSWSGMDLAFKCGHLIRWWPEIRAIIERSEEQKSWWIPAGMQGAFKEVQVGAMMRSLEKQTKKG